MKTPSLNGSRYFILFIDDFSRMCWVFFMKKRSEVFEVFENFKASVKNQSCSKIKSLRTNNGSEYNLEKLKKFYDANGIHHQLTVRYIR